MSAMIVCKHSGCGKSYSESDDAFHRDKRRKSGFHPYCKSCRKKDSEALYAFKNPKKENLCIDCKNNIDHLNYQRIRCDSCRDARESKRKRAAKDKSRQASLARIWRKNNPEKYKANMKKHNELRKLKTKIKEINAIRGQ